MVKIVNIVKWKEKSQITDRMKITIYELLIEINKFINWQLIKINFQIFNQNSDTYEPELTIRKE